MYRKEGMKNFNIILFLSCHFYVDEICYVLVSNNQLINLYQGNKIEEENNKLEKKLYCHFHKLGNHFPKFRANDRENVNASDKTSLNIAKSKCKVSLQNMFRSQP